MLCLAWAAACDADIRHRNNVLDVSIIRPDAVIVGPAEKQNAGALSDAML